MGGRGGSSGFNNNNTALPKNSPEITIDTYYRRGSGYGQNVLEAIETSQGAIKFINATADFLDDRIKANTRDVQFKIRNGAVYHNKRGYEFHGINWDKVNSVSGETYAMKEEIKEKGFKWDRDNKRWVRR